MEIDELLAGRTRGMEASAVREILKVASSPGVVSLAGGLPAVESFPLEIMEEFTGAVLARYGGRALQYDASEGFGPLRETFVPHLAERGVSTDANGVLVFSGSQGVLDAIGKLFISPGDVVAVEAPTYLGALQAFNPYEPRYVELETDEDGLVPESLERVLTTERVKFVYLVPTFQNPTGRTLPLARRKQVAELLRVHGALLAEDDPYSDLRYTGKRLPPIKALAPDNVVYISTLSKTFAPGLRVGFCVAPEAVQHWLVIARQGVDLHTSTLSQALAAEYIAGGHLARQLPKILALYRPRQEAMLEALERHMPEDFRWTRPDGGMFVWMEGAPGLDTERLYERTVASGVAFVPGKFFYVRESDGLATLRMNFTAADPATIDRAVEVIARCIGEEFAAAKR
ncbi:MAG: PLP-dependent aminotransferase family protein [Tepidiformaceae bacterium]